MSLSVDDVMALAPVIPVLVVDNVAGCNATGAGAGRGRAAGRSR